MVFEYSKQTVFTKSIDIVDIGNTCIRLTSAGGTCDYYLYTKTVMGKTMILKVGPVMPDMKMLLNGYSVFFQKIDYKEALINKQIKLFINDPKKEIDDLVEVTEAEMFDALPDLQSSINEF